MLSWTISDLLIRLYCKRAAVTEKGKIDGWMEIRRVHGRERCVTAFVTGRLLQWIACHRLASAARHHRLWVLCEPLAFSRPPHFLWKRHNCSLPGFGFHLLSPCLRVAELNPPGAVSGLFLKRRSLREQPVIPDARFSVATTSLWNEGKEELEEKRRKPRSCSASVECGRTPLFAWWPAFLDPSQEALREHLDSFVSLFCGCEVWQRTRLIVDSLISLFET